jgi:hypothetical protein
VTIPRALALYVALLRAEVASASRKRLKVRRARIATELQELLSLVDVTIAVKRAGDHAGAACAALFDDLERAGVSGAACTAAERQRALAAIDALEWELRAARPSDEARALGLAW